MKKITSILIFIVLFIIAGCSSKEVIKHNYTYKGENGLWTAEYKVNGTGTFFEENGKTHYESKANNTLTVTFRKDLSELSSVKHLEMSFESSAGGGKFSNNFNKNNPINQKTFILESGGKGVAIEGKDEIIIVTINLDGKIQTIELKNQD